ncbi:hypothetical protein HGM15179_007080 [Zosterops borbonicus]|uniref:Uncharacterized protein n=1 Tax=Zosterops borbonicus TaxID=364589 RepID=A0A8K1GJF5_9PASS|nr:hypothetical protein HGM15179_007080 [Zosterops borbonicus]
MLKVEVRDPAEPELQELYSAWMSTCIQQPTLLFHQQAADERRSRPGEAKLQDTGKRLQDSQILGRED